VDLKGRDFQSRRKIPTINSGFSRPIEYSTLEEALDSQKLYHSEGGFIAGSLP
jgi:hypothetical protein